jgi:hypothetical protein
VTRARTKGDTLTLRLPIEAHAELVRRAERKGLSVRAYLEAALVASLSAPPPVAARPPSREVDPRFKSA